jgi:hypothetical protein
MDDKSKCDGTGSCSSPVRRVTAVEANGAALTPHDQRLPAQLLQSRAKFLASHAHSVKLGFCHRRALQQLTVPLLLL